MSQVSASIPAVSFRQAWQALRGRFAGNKNVAKIYRTHLDPVSPNALIKSKMDNRELIHVHTTPASEVQQSHDLDHHFTNNEIERDVEQGFVKVEKHNNVMLAAHAIGGTLDGLQAFFTGYDAIHMAESKVSPEDFSNEMSQDFNMLPENFDPEYHWTDDTAPGPVWGVGQLLKSHERTATYYRYR